MSRGSLTSLFLIAPCFFLACQSGEESGLPPAGERVMEGDRALAAGQPKAARQAFEVALAQRPEDFLAYIGLARTGLAERDPELFERGLSGALKTNPATAASDELLARTLLMASSMSKPGVGDQYAATAASFLVRARERDPTLPHLHYHQALAQKRLGRDEAALRLLEASFAVEPGFEPAWSLTVEILAQRRQWAAILQLLSPRETAGNLTPALAASLAKARAHHDQTSPGPAVPDKLP